MDERQEIWAELNRYRMFRELLIEENAIAALDELIRQTSDRLAQLESGRSPPTILGTAGRAATVLVGKHLTYRQTHSQAEEEAGAA